MTCYIIFGVVFLRKAKCYFSGCLTANEQAKVCVLFDNA